MLNLLKSLSFTTSAFEWNSYIIVLPVLCEISFHYVFSMSYVRYWGLSVCKDHFKFHNFRHFDLSLYSVSWEKAVQTELYSTSVTHPSDLLVLLQNYINIRNYGVWIDLYILVWILLLPIHVCVCFLTEIDLSSMHIGCCSGKILGLTLD